MAFDEATHRLRYEMRGAGLPALVVRSSNEWQVHRLDDMASAFSMTVTIELFPVVGHAVRSRIEARLREQLRATAEELKHYVETGRPHDRKVENIRNRSL